jgi:hypothetical protein
MKKSATFAALCVLTLSASVVQADTRCFGAIDGLQVAVDSGGALRLYIYSSEFGGSNYMTYSGTMDVLKAFHAQLLYARAAEQRICVAYTPGTPSYVWNLTSVGVARPDGYPFE